MIFTFSIGSILLFLDIEIPPSRFYISMSYLGVAYQIPTRSRAVFSLSMAVERNQSPQVLRLMNTLELKDNPSCRGSRDIQDRVFPELHQRDVDHRCQKDQLPVEETEHRTRLAEQIEPQ